MTSQLQGSLSRAADGGTEGRARQAAAGAPPGDRSSQVQEQRQVQPLASRKGHLVVIIRAAV